MNSDATKELGQRIRNIRTKKGYTQNQFSEVADISINFLSDIENNKKKPSIETLVKICDRFDISADYILFGIDHDSHSVLEVSKYVSNLSDEDLQLLVDYSNTLKKMRGLD